MGTEQGLGICLLVQRAAPVLWASPSGCTIVDLAAFSRDQPMTLVPLRDIPRIVAPGARLLGLDVGSRTIGVALSDATWTVATPVSTLTRRRLALDLQAIAALTRELEAEAFIVGLPVQMDGSEGRRCQSVRQFVRDLTLAVELPAALWDERLSTQAIERTLIAEADLSRKRRKQVIDRAAAAWILQGALDALRFAAASSRE
jgi:putative Holliday junction resolvase